MVKKGGSNRDWGYASYDVDRYDDYSDSNLGYTSYENNGKVNKYFDNGDGGHSHEKWNNRNDYNQGNNPDYSRSKSNDSNNPSTGEVQSNGGCYLTSACMKHMQENFDDNCEELMILRWFRDIFVSREDIDYYYDVAPLIVEAIDSDENSELVYDYIYDNIIDYCITEIEKGNYDLAYKRYKESVLSLEGYYIKTNLNHKLIRAL